MLRITKTQNGMVKGLPAADPRITAYKGIPFAKPPVGENRWKAPQPAENWDGIRECFQFAPISMQDIPGKDPDNLYTREWHVDPDIPMSEDCLYLNVWTPARSENEKLPVMVWIFGGGFNCGYTAEMEFDGERIARRGVILVSVNYRVGVFGFLTHPELMEEDPDGCYGNYGMQDQCAALEWVKKNIRAFGGDPENITIFGQSAGAGSVINLLTSPGKVEAGLFHKAIFQSGGGLRAYGQGNHMLTLEEARKNGEEFFEKNGIQSLKQARETDAKLLWNMGSAFGGMDKWAPVVDGRFLLQDPSDALMKNEYPDIPVMFGCTGGEYELRGIPTPETTEQLASFAGEKFGERAEEFLELCDAHTDEQVKKIGYEDDAFKGRFMNNILFLWQRIHNNHENNYMYYFNASIPGWDDPGAFHSSELWFVFETLAKCWRPFHGKHYDLARKICNYWTNFAKTGNPNGPDQDGRKMPEWKSATMEDMYIHYLNEEYIGPYENYMTAPVKFRIDYVFGNTDMIKE